MSIFWRVEKQVRSCLPVISKYNRSAFFMRKDHDCSRGSYYVGFNNKGNSPWSNQTEAEILLLKVTTAHEARAIVSSLKQLQNQVQ